MKARTTVHKDHEVIAPVTSLRTRAVIDDGKGDGWDTSALQRAEAAMATLSSEFPAWMREEVERLEMARRAAQATAFAAGEVRDTLFRAAHDVRGHAGTFGFPLAGAIAEGLCELIEGLDGVGAGGPALIGAHVDAIRAIQRHNTRDAADQTTAAVIAALAKARTAILPPPAEASAPSQAAER